MDREKLKQLIIDMILNLVGTGFPLVILQLIIYPMVARLITADAYGEMQAIMSIVYLVGGTLGGTLSTTRLIREFKYKEKQVTGDFNVLYWVNIIVVIVVTSIILLFYLNDVSVYDVVLILVVTIFNYMINYLEVGFRLQLDFKKIFFDKVLCCIGYVCGFGLFLLTLDWEYIFILSYFFPIVYCLRKTFILKEVRRKTILFNETCVSFCNLGFASLLDKALIYFDKLLLYPLLGGTSVSIYFAANIFGKLMLQILEPITNVILSYLSKRAGVSKNIWKLTIVMSVLFCSIMYFVCILISAPILSFFYPQWADAAMKLIPIATGSLCISSFISVIYPLTLKTLKTYQQIIINGISLVIYIGCALLLYEQYNLVGCCSALLISYTIKLFCILVFCFKKKNKAHQ